MKASTRYVKIVEWSEEDQCYVGSSPGLIWGGCHGDDEQSVFAELCQVVEEAIDLLFGRWQATATADIGQGLVEPSAGRSLNKPWSNRRDAALHTGKAQ